MPTDLEIAQAAQPKRIQEIAEKAGIPEGAISPYGQYIAKVDPMQLGVGSEMRAMDAYEYAAGFKGMERMRVDGSDFTDSFEGLSKAIEYVRKNRAPILVHAKCPLLGHHTSGVRMEWYRDDLEEAQSRDPYPVLIKQLLEAGFTQQEIQTIENTAVAKVQADFDKAQLAEDPTPEDLFTHDFAPTSITEEVGERNPEREDKVVMVDCALFAVEELMKKHQECLLYGQDVGGRLGGVFREAATLAQKFGDERVFNTPIQEAFIVGSTVGMSAVGLKPIVEVQFADYIWPGLNQLFTDTIATSPIKLFS